MNKLAVLAFTILMFCSTMLWYLADGSLNDYLKSQVVLQGQYYSGQQTNVAQANFSSNTGVLTIDQLTLANEKNNVDQNTIFVDQVLVQLARAKPSASLQKNNKDITKEVQHITVEKVTINKLRFNVIKALESNNMNNLEQLQQQISQKLATDYPALYPDIAAKLYAKKHPELNVELVNTSAENRIKAPVIETNQAIIESKAAKHKKRILGKATTRITILALTINTFEINTISENGTNTVQQFTDVELPTIGEEHGLASNQMGGEILRVLLHTANQLKNTTN